MPETDWHLISFFFFYSRFAAFKREDETEENHYRMKEVWKTEEVIESLPYQLTKAQQNVWYEIERDLKGERLMARLVQGDVGSGKTIIAFLAMIMAAENGYQSALMVAHRGACPSALRGANRIIEGESPPGRISSISTGSNTAKEKRQIYEKIASGEARMISGISTLIRKRWNTKVFLW